MTNLEPTRSTVDAYLNDGYVIFHEALPSSLVARLYKDYMAALEAKQGRFGLRHSDMQRSADNRFGRPDFLPLGGNHDVNRWNMHLPSRMPFLDPRVISNDRVMELVDAVMGDRCVLTMLASDAAAPGSQPQEVHQDGIVTRMVANVALTDCTIENGAIELWPGSHRPTPFERTGSFTYRMPQIPVDRIADIVAKVPSVRGVMKAGSILVRDHRLLHRGTENKSNEIRPMLSLLYFDDADELPLRPAVNAAAAVALGLRKIVRRLPPSERQARWMSRANAAGRIVEFSARSDRDYRRVIPRDVWSELPERTRRLLRYARVEDGADLASHRSLKATKEMVRGAWRGMSAALGGKMEPPARSR